VPFGVSDPQNNGTPKFLFQKIVFYSPLHAEKFADFNGIIIFEIRQTLAEISLKMW